MTSEHMPIYVNAAGDGPLDEGDADVAGEVCLECGEPWRCGPVRVEAAIAVAARPIVLVASVPTS